jgi:hypothetical protein
MQPARSHVTHLHSLALILNNESFIMRSLSIVRRCAAAAVVLFSVLSFHSVAHAQPGYYPPPRGYARPYAGPYAGPYPRVYPAYPPASSYYYPPAPRYYQPPRDPLYRPISLSLGLGAGALSVHDAWGHSSDAGLSYTARLGLGLARNWGLYLGIEGTGVGGGSSSGGDCCTDSGPTGHGASQTAYLMGVQIFPVDRLYLRFGIGAAVASFEDAPSLRVHRVAAALNGALGVELAQGRNAALALEASATGARYSEDETWSNFGLNLVVTFY